MLDAADRLELSSAKNQGGNYEAFFHCCPRRVDGCCNDLNIRIGVSLRGSQY
jgi:hypothetical protein